MDLGSMGFFSVIAIGELAVLVFALTPVMFSLRTSFSCQVT